MLITVKSSSRAWPGTTDLCCQLLKRLRLEDLKFMSYRKKFKTRRGKVVILFQDKMEKESQRCISLVEHLSSMSEVLSSIPSTA